MKSRLGQVPGSKINKRHRFYNVFEFFAKECEIELGLWEKTLHALKTSKDQTTERQKFVVTIPSIQESLSTLEKKIVKNSNDKNNNVQADQQKERVSKLIQFAKDNFETVPIDPSEMIKLAKYCTGDYMSDDDEDEDDEDEDKDVEGKEEKDKEKEEQIEELLEDFGEMTLYSC